MALSGCEVNSGVQCKFLDKQAPVSTWEYKLDIVADLKSLENFTCYSFKNIMINKPNSNFISIKISSKWICFVLNHK